MGNQDKIQQISEEIVRLEDQRDQGVSDESKDRINAQIKGLVDERTALEAADQESEIEEKVASIVLPYDFNDLYENSTANATIIEIVQQFKRQDLVEHNAEIQSLIQLHKDEVRASNDREMQLQRQNKTLQNDLADAQEKNSELRTVINDQDKTISELQDELQDVRQSRDNAALQIEEQKLEIERLNSHVDDLVKEQAVGAREAHKVIETNQTLNQLIEKANAEKQAKIKSAAELVLENNAPFRGKVELPSVPQQEFPFSGENGENTTTGSADVQLPSTEAPQTAEVATFPTINPPDVQGPSTGMAVEPSSSGGEGGETATKEWVNARLAQHKAEIIAEITGEKVA